MFFFAVAVAHWAFNLRFRCRWFPFNENFAYFLKKKIFLRVVWGRCWEIRFQSERWGRSWVQVNIIIIVKRMWLGNEKLIFLLFYLSMGNVSLLQFLWLISICSKNCLRLCSILWFIKKGSFLFSHLIYWF